jgi:hypothetical protein
MYLCVRVLPILVLEGSVARPDPQTQPSPLPQRGQYPIHLFECSEQNLHGCSITRNPGPAHEDSMYLRGKVREGGRLERWSCCLDWQERHREDVGSARVAGMSGGLGS